MGKIFTTKPWNTRNLSLKKTINNSLSDMISRAQPWNKYVSRVFCECGTLRGSPPFCPYYILSFKCQHRFVWLWYLQQKVSINLNATWWCYWNSLSDVLCWHDWRCVIFLVPFDNFIMSRHYLRVTPLNNHTVSLSPS